MPVHTLFPIDPCCRPVCVRHSQEAGTQVLTLIRCISFDMHVCGQEIIRVI